jgi:iron complex outermembrane receptor protein
LPGWRVIASYAYTDAKITQDNRYDIGNRLVNVPKNSASLWTTYEVQKGGLQGLGFGVGLRYVGEREGDLENSFELPSYFRTDAAIFYRRNNFRAALNVNNLFDTEYFEAAQNGRAGVFPGAPLTVIGTIGFEF